VTEESMGGVMGSQGSWAVNVEGSTVKGSAQLQLANGTPLSYNFGGEQANGVYTITLTDRTDGKKGCVWSGHAPSGASAQTQGLVGYAQCEGTKLILRASFFKK
jgi:hypothetical protein